MGQSPSIASPPTLLLVCEKCGRVAAKLYGHIEGLISIPCKDCRTWEFAVARYIVDKKGNTSLI